MKRKGAHRASAAARLATAANEEFDMAADELDRLEYSRLGWDPYEVWRTRVKSCSRAKGERGRDRLR